MILGLNLAGMVNILSLSWGDHKIAYTWIQV